MLSTSFAFAPAGVLGAGSAVVRPHTCAAVRPSALPPVAVVRGTGVPFAGMTRVRGAAPAGTGLQITQATPKQHALSTTNDGTTPIGIHSPGRPKS